MMMMLCRYSEQSNAIDPATGDRAIEQVNHTITHSPNHPTNQPINHPITLIPTLTHSSTLIPTPFPFPSYYSLMTILIYNTPKYTTTHPNAHPSLPYPTSCRC